VLVEKCAGSDFELSFPIPPQYYVGLPSAGDVSPQSAGGKAGGASNNLSMASPVGTNDTSEQDSVSETNTVVSFSENPVQSSDSDTIGESSGGWLITDFLKRSGYKAPHVATAGIASVYPFSFAPRVTVSSGRLPVDFLFDYTDYFSNIFAFFAGTLNITVFASSLENNSSNLVATLYPECEDVFLIDRSGIPLVRGTGTTVVNTRVNGAVTLNAPWYNNIPFSPVHTSITSSDVVDRINKPIYSYSLFYSDNIDIYRSCNDDFEFNFLVGVPLLYPTNTTTTPSP
jgi:hypothetical protein